MDYISRKDYIIHHQYMNSNSYHVESAKCVENFSFIDFGV
jgi:hypothetical protein